MKEIYEICRGVRGKRRSSTVNRKVVKNESWGERKMRETIKAEARSSSLRVGQVSIGPVRKQARHVTPDKLGYGIEDLSTSASNRFSFDEKGKRKEVKRVDFISPIN